MRETPYNFVVNHDDKIIVVTSQWAARPRNWIEISHVIKVGPTQSTIQWIPELTRPEHEADHTRCNVYVKNEWMYKSTLHVCMACTGTTHNTLNCSQCFIWKWSVFCHTERRKLTENVWEQSSCGNIWSPQQGSAWQSSNQIIMVVIQIKDDEKRAKIIHWWDEKSVESLVGVDRIINF